VKDKRSPLSKKVTLHKGRKKETSSLLSHPLGKECVILFASNKCFNKMG